MRILLIEPDLVLAKTYRHIFEQNNWQVDWQTSTQKAIAAADRHRPDIIILELKLAGHSGPEFLYEFRSYADWQDVPIIILSLVPEREVKVSKHVWDKLNIKKYMYKPTTSLAQLQDFVEGLQPVNI